MEGESIGYMKKEVRKPVIYILIIVGAIMFGGVCGTGIYRVSNEAKNESLYLEEQISSEIEITEEKDINTEAGNILETESNLNEILEQNDEDNNYIDLADKYIVYKEGMAIVIEEKMQQMNFIGRSISVILI